MKTRYIYLTAWSVFLPLVLPVPWASWLYVLAIASALFGVLDMRMDLTARFISSSRPDEALHVLEDRTPALPSYSSADCALIEQEERRYNSSLERASLHRSRLANCSRRGLAAFVCCGAAAAICVGVSYGSISMARGFDGPLMVGLLWSAAALPFAFCALILSFYPLERLVHWGRATWSVKKARRLQHRFSTMRSSLALEQGSLSEVVFEQNGQLHVLNARNSTADTVQVVDVRDDSASEVDHLHVSAPAQRA